MCGLASVALAIVPPTHPITGIKRHFEPAWLAPGIIWIAGSVVVFILFGSRVWGWIGLGYLAIMILCKPFVDSIGTRMLLSPCRSCKKRTLPNANFCAWCGHPIITESPETTTEPTTPSD